MNHCADVAKEWMPHSTFVFVSAGERLVDSTNCKQKKG
jgi:hypothetical protein